MSSAKYFYLLMFIILSGYVGGCSKFENVSRETFASMPETYIKAPNQTGVKNESIGRWWENFNDKNLNSLMVRAFKENEDLKQAIARLKKARATEQIALAPLIPFVNLGGNASRDRQQYSIFGESFGNTYRWSLDAGYEVDLWGKLKNKKNAATLEKNASKEDVKTVYMTLSARVAELYFYIIEQQKQIELTNDIIRTQQDTLERIEKRYEAGLVGALDTYQARQNILGAKSKLPGLEAEKETALSELSLLLGKFPDETIMGKNNELPKSLFVVDTGIPANLLTNRPDIKAAYLRLAAKNATLAAAIKERLPSINIIGSLGQTTFQIGGATSTGNVWSILGEIAAPLIDGGRRRGEIKMARADIEEEVSRYAQVVMKAVKEVNDSLARKKAASKKVNILSERAKATDASLRLANESYFEGTADYLQVLASQQVHFDTLSQLIGAKKQEISETISLVRSLGGKWIEEESKKNIADKD